MDRLDSSKSLTWMGFVLLALLLVLPGAAVAQEQDPPEESEEEAQQPEEDRVFLEEVTVTATRREESLQDIPIAVTAISELEIERTGLQDIRDLPLLAPSFNMNSTQTESQGSTLRIRGVGTTGNNIGLESAVGVFLDGVYLSRPGVALGDQLDVEAIEVLRGPQGTLFGRNVSAGALNIRTKEPNLVGVGAFGNFTVGNFEAYNGQAGVTGPLTENLGYRVSGAFRQRDGYLESVTGAESLNRDRVLGRGQLLWQGDRAALRLIGDVSDADENCCDAVILVETPGVALGSFAAAGLPANGGVVFSGDSAFEERRTNAEQFENPFEQRGFSAEFDLTIGQSAALTYIGAWRDFRAESVQHTDFNSMSVFSVRPEVAGGFETFDDIETITHELRIDGTAGDLAWMLGAYYSDETILEHQGLGLEQDYTRNMDAMLWNFAFAPVLAPAQLLAGVPLATGGTFGDVLASGNQALAFAGGVDAAGSYAQNIFEQEGESWSVFTHNTWSVTDTFDLHFGLRYVDETKDGRFDQLFSNNQACLNTVFNAGALAAGAAGTGLEVVASTIGNFSAGFACFPFTAPADTGISILPATFDTTFEDEELVYTGQFSFEFTDAVSAYAGYTHGFKSGGFNLDATAASGGSDPRFDSEKIDSIELGLKSEFLERRVRLNATVFDYDIEDFQVLEFTGVAFQTFNVPKAQSRGAEVEVSARAGNNLRLNLAYTYADSEYPDDCDLNDPNAPATVSGLCGAAFTNAPENVAVFGASWDGTVGDRFLYFLSTNARYEDDRRTSTQPGLARDVQEANTKLHLRLGLGSYSGSWSWELWGDNITDEQTRNVTFNTPLRVNSRGAFLEAPRTFGTTLRLRF